MYFHRILSQQNLIKINVNRCYYKYRFVFEVCKIIKGIKIGPEKVYYGIKISVSKGKLNNALVNICLVTTLLSKSTFRPSSSRTNHNDLIYIDV